MGYSHFRTYEKDVLKLVYLCRKLTVRNGQSGELKHQKIFFLICSSLSSSTPQLVVTTNRRTIVITVQTLRVDKI